MSHHAFDPECPDCRPVIIDPSTGQVLPPEHPVMVAVNKVWEASTFEDREAFHRVTVLNSRAPDDLQRMQAMAERIESMAKN
jgi:hypothetical protein